MTSKILALAFVMPLGIKLVLNLYLNQEFF